LTGLNYGVAVGLSMRRLLLGIDADAAGRRRDAAVGDAAVSVVLIATRGRRRGLRVGGFAVPAVLMDAFPRLRPDRMERTV